MQSTKPVRSICVYCGSGFGDDGLPCAVQLVGRAHDETTLLTLAAQLERARPWADARPPL